MSLLTEDWCDVFSPATQVSPSELQDVFNETSSNIFQINANGKSPISHAVCTSVFVTWRALPVSLFVTANWKQPCLEQGFKLKKKKLFYSRKFSNLNVDFGACYCWMCKWYGRTDHFITTTSFQNGILCLWFKTRAIMVILTLTLIVLFFVFSLPPVVTLEKNLQSLGTSRDTAELRQSLWVMFE